MELELREDYEFTSDWFSWNIDTWQRVFANVDIWPHRVIEIGSYEGRSTVWIVENLLTRAGGSIVAIDAWAEGTERDQKEMRAVENRFDWNIGVAKRLCPTVEIQKCKGPSWLALSQLIEKGFRGTFDFIYIDGNHQAADVLTDLVLGFRLYRVGGLIFCDDYLWEMHRPVTETPKLAIDSFLACFHLRMRIIPERFYQIYLQKTAD
jgi:predicted O-methyltransferase YrrM